MATHATCTDSTCREPYFDLCCSLEKDKESVVSLEAKFRRHPGARAVSLAQAQTLTVLYSFKGGTDGASSYAGLVRDSAGNLYGTTYDGGNQNCASGCGTVFKLSATGKKTQLYSFTGKADGASPLAGLIRDSGGNLYGTTRYGGNSSCGGGCGTVFKVDATGKETVLHSFTGPTDGSVPQGILLRDVQGNLYGTTTDGGDSSCDNGVGCGIVFKLDGSRKRSCTLSRAERMEDFLPQA